MYAKTISILFYPTGVVRVWKSSRKFWLKCLYTVIGLPVFLVIFSYLSIVLFGAFLPPLDRSVGMRRDKTIVNSEGNYSATFLKSGAETNGAYELVKVELEPYGGNDWHYHKTFVEEFTVLEGKVSIGHEKTEQMLTKKTQTARAGRGTMHYFKNAGAEKAVLLVKVTPASGLEKTLRVAYGLMNDGLLENDMTENPWHMALLLGYSESYLPYMPAPIQEPLIDSFAKIAQWKGEDKVLYKYFK